MELVTNDGVRLNYQVHGQGQPIIFVEGFGGYQEIWNLQVEYFLGMRYQIITYDHRNHGQSQRTDKNLTLKQLTDDLETLVNYLKLDNPILIGHSMGASVCYSYLQRKNKVKAVMAIDQSPKMLNDKNWIYGFEDITADNFQSKLVQKNNIHETLHGLDNRVFEDLNQAKAMYPFDREQTLPLLFDHVQKDWRSALTDTQVPVTLIVAKQSPYFDYRFGEVVSKTNPKIKTFTIDNSGHDIMAEVPDEFNQVLRHFVLSSSRK